MSVKFLLGCLLVIASRGQGALTITTPSSLARTFLSPAYGVSASNFSVVNATLDVHVGFSCVEDNAIPQAPTNNSLFYAVFSLCYPEELALKVQDAGYVGLVIANGIAPATGLWAICFWNKKGVKSTIPVVDVRANIVQKQYLQYGKVNALANLDPSTNPFESLQSSTGFIVLLVVSHLSTSIQMFIAANRAWFSWQRVSEKTKRSRASGFSKAKSCLNTVILITLFHVIGALTRQIMLIDPFGVFGLFNFPATTWLVFFSITASEIGFYIQGFTYHQVIARVEENFFSSGETRGELKLVLLASGAVLFVNLVLTLFNSIAGIPDSFFLVLIIYGLVQVYMFWYIFNYSMRTEELRNASGTPMSLEGPRYSEHVSTRNIRLLFAGSVVIAVYTIVFQPVSFGVLVFGSCGGGFNGDCSILLTLLLLAIILINVSVTLQLLALPGETKEQWINRTRSYRSKSFLSNSDKAGGLEIGSPLVSSTDILLNHEPSATEQNKLLSTEKK